MHDSSKFYYSIRNHFDLFCNNWNNNTMMCGPALMPLQYNHPTMCWQIQHKLLPSGPATSSQLWASKFIHGLNLLSIKCLVKLDPDDAVISRGELSYWNKTYNIGVWYHNISLVNTNMHHSPLYNPSFPSIYLNKIVETTSKKSALSWCIVSIDAFNKTSSVYVLPDDPASTSSYCLQLILSPPPHSPQTCSTHSQKTIEKSETLPDMLHAASSCM